MKKHLVIVEKTKTGFSVFSPDLDGCITTGKAKAEVEQLMKESMQFHLEGMKEGGLRVPASRSYPT